jgi:glycosyltransferase involved in cell wall biosynthesis
VEAVRVGLFTYHDDTSTASYLRNAMDTCGDDVVPLGVRSPDASPTDVRGFADAAAGLDALLFVDPPGPFWPAGLEEIECPTAAYLIDTHQDLGLRLAYAPFFDELFVAQRNDVAAVHDAGYPGARWLPLAAEPASARDPVGSRSLDVAFVGKLTDSGTLRRRVLDTVAATFETNEIRRSYSPSQMCELYGQAKIVVNASVSGDLNMRVFEAMVSGALLVTDRVTNGLDLLFVEGEHYVGYSSPSEAQAVIGRYLDDKDERVRIATTAQRQVLERHTYRDRWRTIREQLTPGNSMTRALASASAETRRRAYAHLCARLGKPSLVWRATKPWTPRVDSPSNLFATAVALGRMTNNVVPFTPRAVRARTRRWRDR